MHKKRFKRSKALILKDRDVTLKNSELKDKRFAFAICGGIGATEAVKIGREIRRRGALVQAFLSPEAERFITPLSVEWATSKKAIRRAGPGVEYLEHFDVVLVCPATLHTLSKAALALSETVVDLVIAQALGTQTPLFMVPTMNQAMWINPILKKHLKELKGLGVRFFPENIEEDRLKVPEPSLLLDWITEQLKK